MGNINWARVLLGGLLAGVIIDASEFVINAVILKQDWADALTKLNKPSELPTSSLAIFNVVGLVLGILAVWLYAAIRPRFGAGPKTAVNAAIAIWILGYLLPAAGQAAVGLIPLQPIEIATGLGLIEIVIASIAGAYVYKEANAPAARSAAAGS